MKRFKLKVLCRGCSGEIIVEFDARPHFDPVILPYDCPHCNSELGVHVKRGMFASKLNTKVTMISHTQKLLDILKKRRDDAKNYA